MANDKDIGIILGADIPKSTASNIGISKSKIYLDKKKEYIKFKTPVKQFKKIDFYKEKF